MAGWMGFDASRHEAARRHFTLALKPAAEADDAPLAGYMGTVQAGQGDVDAACRTWSRALDAMDGVQSGRAREAVVTMRTVLPPFRHRGIPSASAVDARARAVLQRVI
ncbi:hypothetical protein [Streptomyces sp. NPDC001744]|uniref:hypothetical protein n=1 Tax=Streptomyces sp. NPDC001744 TaxID=3364606 RepID=UPI0036CED827